METRSITVKEIAKFIGGTVLCGDENQIIDRISTDSREYFANELFVPIVGAKVDAHRFLVSALGNGVCACITHEHSSFDDVLKSYAEENAPYDNKIWIHVEDTRLALHKLGFLFRTRIHVPIIGVSGSVGKTTTREMIAHAMNSQASVFKTEKNYNSQFGVPITMSMLRNNVDYAVLELGMNVPGELTMIAEMAAPEVGVLTNVGVAHIEFYQTQDNIAKEKLSIGKGVADDGLMVLNGDDFYLTKYSDLVSQKKVYYGTSRIGANGVLCDYYSSDLVSDENGSRFTLHVVTDDDEVLIPVELTVPGRHNCLNALAAFAVCDYYQLNLVKVAESLKDFKGFMNRLSVITTASGYTVIDDTYNASPTSMKAGLDVLCDRKCEGRRIAVLGDMFELGENSPLYHSQIGEYAAQKDIDFLICIGENATHIADEYNKSQNISKKAVCFSMDTAITFLKERLHSGDIVYLKASNGMHFKSIVESIIK